MKLKENPLITDLVGEKTTKLSSKVTFFGKVDLLSCHLMEVRCYIDNEEQKDDLLNIVKTLSIIMGEVAGGKTKLELLDLESLLKINKKYEVNNGIVTKFVLPGQNKVSSMIHITRCVAREAELEYAKVYEEGFKNDLIFEYLNKMSTLLYNLALGYEL